MKTKAYIRVAKLRNGRSKVEASSRPNPEPLRDSNGYAYPTVGFAVELNLPDKLFTRHEQVLAKLSIPEDQAEILADVVELEADVLR